MNADVLNPHLEGESFLWKSGLWGALLFHGFTATTAEVRPLAKKMLEAGYTVSGPLLPGHGSAPAALNQVKWREWVDCAEKAYIELASQCRGVVIGGESMGALLALAVAARQPGIQGIILYAPAYQININWLDQLRLRLVAPFIPAFPKRKIDEAGKWQGYRVNPVKAVLELLALQRHVKKSIHVIKQPLLIFQGRLDTTIHPGSGERILQGVESTNKQLVWMEKSPHVIILGDEIDEVTSRTLEFIQSIIH